MPEAGERAIVQNYQVWLNAIGTSATNDISVAPIWLGIMCASPRNDSLCLDILELIAWTAKHVGNTTLSCQKCFSLPGHFDNSTLSCQTCLLCLGILEIRHWTAKMFLLCLDIFEIIPWAAKTCLLCLGILEIITRVANNVYFAWTCWK